MALRSRRCVCVCVWLADADRRPLGGRGVARAQLAILRRALKVSKWGGLIALQVGTRTRRQFLRLNHAKLPYMSPPAGWGSCSISSAVCVRPGLSPPGPKKIEMGGVARQVDTRTLAQDSATRAARNTDIHSPGRAGELLALPDQFPAMTTRFSLRPSELDSCHDMCLARAKRRDFPSVCVSSLRHGWTQSQQGLNRQSNNPLT